MCGIAGMVGNRQPVDAELVRRMRDAQAHRGPDDIGLEVSKDRLAAFGHRRLSIIDLTGGGHQPRWNAAGTLLLTFNGEIYNYRELRRELEASGYRFTTASDSEVLLAALEEWGVGALKRLRGMFALALWNAETRTCWLARDPLGIKPLYYGVTGDRLYFASEATALLEATPFQRRVDPGAVADYLVYGYVPAPKSIWRGIAKLEPGHWLAFGEGVTRRSAYWQARDHALETDTTTDAAVLGALEDAVHACMVADVPVAAFLSGGLDSATVASHMVEAKAATVRTFTIDFEGSPDSEAAAAALVAGHLGTDHHSRVLSGLPTLEAVASAQTAYDEPIADESTLPTLAICQAVSESTKVVVSGDGGDEIFAGYRWYAKAARIERWRRRLGPLAGLVRYAPSAGWKRRLAPLQGWSPQTYHQLMGFLTPAETGACLGGDRDDTDPYWKWRRHWHPELPLVKRLQLLDLNCFLPDDILAKVDRASMHHSLEVRVPLLDHRLVEEALKLPVAQLLVAGQGKLVLRQHAANRLPSAILERPKRGFSLPKEGRADFAAACAQRLEAGQLRQRGWLPPALLAGWRAQASGRTPNKLWALVTLDLWLEAQGVQ